MKGITRTSVMNGLLEILAASLNKKFACRFCLFSDYYGKLEHTIFFSSNINVGYHRFPWEGTL